MTLDVGLVEHQLALRKLWRDVAEKGIEHGVDWPYVVRTLFRDIDAAAARVAAERERANTAAIRAYDDGYNDAATMAHCYGHTDHWPSGVEPRNPYRAALDTPREDRTNG